MRHRLPIPIARLNARRTRREALLALWGGVSAMALLGGCTEPLPPVRLGSVVYPGYELLFLAREMGQLDERQLRLVEMRSNADVLRALAAGQLEAAHLTFDELMGARADGLDLRATLVVDVSVGADAVVARHPVPLPQMRGQRIGVEGGTVGDVVLHAMLQAGGLAPGDIRRVRVGMAEAEQMFKSGQLDGVVAAEPLVSRLEALGGHRVYDSGSIDGRVVDVVAVRADVIEPRAAALQHLVARFFDAQRAFLSHAADAAERMAPRLGVAPADVPRLFRGIRWVDAAQNRMMMAPQGGIDRVLEAMQRESAGVRGPVGSLKLAELVDARFLT